MQGLYKDDVRNGKGGNHVRSLDYRHWNNFK